MNIVKNTKKKFVPRYIVCMLLATTVTIHTISSPLFVEYFDYVYVNLIPTYFYWNTWTFVYLFITGYLLQINKSFSYFDLKRNDKMFQHKYHKHFCCIDFPTKLYPPTFPVPRVYYLYKKFELFKSVCPSWLLLNAFLFQANKNDAKAFYCSTFFDDCYIFRFSADT